MLLKQSSTTSTEYDKGMFILTKKKTSKIGRKVVRRTVIWKVSSEDIGLLKGTLNKGVKL